MKIEVKTLTGTSYYLDVEPTDYVLRLQEKIQEKAGIPPDQQTIIYKGKQLDVERTFADYSI
jgi:large subunit ribosomal protein L40e